MFFLWLIFFQKEKLKIKFEKNDFGGFQSP
jgi:hypothetical protein